MLSLRRVVLLTILSVPLLAPLVWGSERVEHDAGAVALRTSAPNPSVQVALTRGHDWQTFQRKYGEWSATWNEATRTPHRAFGKSIALAGYRDEASAVDNAVRRFIGDNPSLFGAAPQLELASARSSGTTWYVSYHQVYQGIPVLFSDWEFRVGRSGKLSAFGADARTIDTAVETTPRLHPNAAREAARAGIAFDPSIDRVEDGERLYLLPRTVDGATEYRLVYEVRVQTRRPRANWLTLVDAITGEVLFRNNQVRAAIQGNSSGPVHMGLPTSPTTNMPFPNMNVNVGGTVVPTNSSGHYSATAGGSVTVSSSLKGPYAEIIRLDGTGASFSQNNVNDPATVNINWTSGNATDGERDAFYHINWAHDRVKAIDPAYPGNDFPILAYVNDTADDCYAYWNGSGLEFSAASPLCPNTATMGDIVYHEYAHSVMHSLYFWRGAFLGLTNLSLSEGLADAFAAIITDDPVIGQGFSGPGTSLRTVDNTRRWPDDATPSAHQSGLIVAGSLWDLRQATRASLVDSLLHYALYGIPDDGDAGTAMNEFFVEVLIADDNDSNLSNGTPHFDAIVNAFNAHGIGTGFFVNITHTPLDDQPTAGPFPIAGVFQYTGPIGALDTNSPTLYFSMNGGPFFSSAMFPTGNPDEWGSQIPQVSGAIVRYYMQAKDTYGATVTEPFVAPTRVHTFVAGPASPVQFIDMESNPGWTAGAAGDNAIAGIWVREDPIGTQAQPADDHTPAPGTLCYVTGNADSLDFPGTNDVDGGKTTLTTNAFDAVSGGISNPIISYYRWFSNNTGDAPNLDPWRVDISNNGGSTWTPVENTTVSDLSWKRIVFFIQEYLTPTTNMRMRFIAADEGAPSLVEAAVDDFSVLGYPSFVDVSDALATHALSLAPAAPNPFGTTTTLRYTLPIAADVELGVFDIHGRSIRRLVQGTQAAGRHAVEWDGRDRNGHRVASGPYFVRLSQDGQRATQAVVRIQ